MENLNLKLHADKCFKDLDLKKALSLYQQALAVDGSDIIVLNSNISACFFELGNYEKCVEYSHLVCGLLKGKDNTEMQTDKNLKILEKNELRLKKCKELVGIKENVLELEKKLIDLIPRYRSPVITDVFEYHPVGHDLSSSVFYGVENDSNELEETDETKIDLINLDENSISSLKFFFGGFGDARHLFGSISDLVSQVELLPKSKQDVLNVRFFLNDIKPHPTAKLLIMLSALRKLSENDVTSINENINAARFFALPFYLFAGNVLPPYLEKLVDGIIEELIQNGVNNDYWSFIKISDNDWNKVKNVLEQWLEPCKITGKQVLDKTKLDLGNGDFSDILGSWLGDAGLAKLNDINTLKLSNQDNKFFNDYHFIKPFQIIMDEKEREIIDDASLNQKMKNKKLRNHVKENWKCNKTMVDYDMFENFGMKDTFFNWDLMDLLHKLTGIQISLLADIKLFKGFFSYFINLATSIKYLIEKNVFTIEPSVCDVYDAISKLRLESSENKFDRIFLSNIPDYTSLLYAFIECLPVLKFKKSSYIMAGCLLNQSLWKDMNHYLYASTLIKSVNETQALVNAFLILGNPYGDDPLWRNSEENFEPSMKNRDELTNWMARILLNYSFPGLRSTFVQVKECYFPNMTIFFRTVKFLIELGYPKHWFLQLIEQIESNNLVTLATYPESSPNSFKINKSPKKLNLTTILFEFNTIAAIYSPILNIGKISKFDHQLIKRYEISFQKNLFDFFESFGKPLDNNLSVLFEEKLLLEDKSNLRDELIKNSSPLKRHLYSMYNYSSVTNIVSFWMSQEEFKNMTTEPNCWYVSLIRTDTWVSLTKPVKLSKAKLSNTQLI